MMSLKAPREDVLAAGALEKICFVPTEIISFLLARLETRSSVRRTREGLDLFSDNFNASVITSI